MQLDWCGFFAYSEEEGTCAADLDGTVAPELMAERLRRAGRAPGRHHRRAPGRPDRARVEVLVDEPGVGRTYREAPEIDGVVLVADDLPVGEFATVVVSASLGPDLVAT